MFTISKEYHFSAAHRLDGLPRSHPCARMHGHNYRVRFTLQGAQDPRGFIVDYREVDALVKPWIAAAVDHYCLNDLMPANPTAENIARWIFDKFARTIPALVAVAVSETEKTWAEYRKD
jgi:6-pyruvoyltetrahydropterin/6-carboxytetrahydropterin synthase